MTFNREKLIAKILSRPNLFFIVFVIFNLQLLSRFTGIQSLVVLAAIASGVICLLGYRRAARLADAANRQKSSFLIRMSHDIRTPMNAIIGMGELLERDYGKPEALAYIEDIKKSGTNLLSLIDDILDFSKIESGLVQIASSSYETASLLNDVLAIIRVRLIGKSVELTVDVDPTIPREMLGDEMRVRQILLNILSNAETYTSEGFIDFSISGEVLDGDSVRLVFEVADSGTGIRAEDTEHIFGDFTSVDIDHNKGIEGAGLGLSSARILCRAMGGDLTVRSEYGDGSVFTASICQICTEYKPLGDFERKSSRRKSSGVVRFTAPSFRVLIVDDNSTNLKVAEGLLSPYMMSIDTCKSGEESVARARENEYDLVLMDHMMPGIDGIEAAHVIRALGGWRAKLPIVALTANAVSGMREMFLKNGFDDFLSKPIEIAKLNRLIEKWVPEEAKRAVSAASATNDAKDQPVFPEISGLDVAAGIAITGGTVENYRSVLEIYCRDAELRVASVNLSKAQDDLKNFTANVHALKSASASIGANALSEEAAYLEDAGKRGDTEAIRERVDAFRGGVSDLIGRIQRMDELK